MTKELSGRYGVEVKMILKVGGDRVEVVRLSIEHELEFISLFRHTKNLILWQLFKEWKEAFGGYMTNLSRFHHLLRQEAEKETGLTIGDLENIPGLLPEFVVTIFKNACNHVFRGYKGFEGVKYAIISQKNDWHQLRFDGYTIAVTSEKNQLERCQATHKRMMDFFRIPSNRPEELIQSYEIWNVLKELESQIFLSLQKLMLKRIFLGHCELCPD